MRALEFPAHDLVGGWAFFQGLETGIGNTFFELVLGGLEGSRQG